MKFFLKVLLIVCFAQIAKAQQAPQLSVIDRNTDEMALSADAAQKRVSKDHLTITQQWQPQAVPGTLKTIITNNGKSQRQLLLRWRLPWSGDNNPRYWNGQSNPMGAGEALSATAIQYDKKAFMIQAVYSSKKGVALAVDPSAAVPKLQQSLIKNGDTLFLQLQIPIALEAKKSRHFSVELYHFAPKYGYLDALQKYFLAHPKTFNHYSRPHRMPKLSLPQKVLLQGWQPVSAARGANAKLPAFIRPMRFGRDLGSYVVLDNTSAEPWSGQVAMDNQYLGNANYLFVGQGGSAMTQFVNGRVTTLDMQIPPQQKVILRAVAQVSRFSQGGATVSWNDDGVDGNLAVKSTFTPNMVTAPRSGWKESASQKEGKPWHFESLYFAAPLAELLKFPFVNGSQQATIVLPTEPSPQETWAAQRIQQYFEDWGQKHAQTIHFKIIKGLAPRKAGQPLIYVGEALDKIEAKNLVLQVGQTEDVTLKQMTLQLLKILNKKYFLSDENAMEK